jgi:hypothetical protein
MDMIVSFAAQVAVGSDEDVATSMHDHAAAMTCVAVIGIFGLARIF